MTSFDEHITETLAGDTQKNALDFAAFLKASGMTTGEGHGMVEGHSMVMYDGKVIAYMHMDGKPDLPGPWTIWPSWKQTVMDGFILDEATIAIVHANVNICSNCARNCARGSTKTVYGKSFDNVCGAKLAFTDPNPETLKCVKTLLEMIKEDIQNGTKSIGHD